MHEIAYNKSKKAIIASLSGYIGVEEANDIFSGFKKSIGGINAKENILVINPENISSSLLVLPMLQSLIQTIGLLGFKKIYIINSDKYAGIIKQGLNNYGISGSVKYVNNIDEALKS
jgi:hypothetical protein